MLDGLVDGVEGRLHRTVVTHRRNDRVIPPTCALHLSVNDGCCEWVVPDDDGRLVLGLEPESRSWMRWLGSLLQLLALKDDP